MATECEATSRVVPAVCRLSEVLFDVGEVRNPKCGRILKTVQKKKDEQIEDVRFQIFWCYAAMASSSKSAERLIGGNVQRDMGTLRRIGCRFPWLIFSGILYHSGFAGGKIHEAINDHPKETGPNLRRKFWEGHIQMGAMCDL